jgi:hypothetical protein
VIGQTVGQIAAEAREANCMAGYTSYSSERIATARDNAQQTMQTYVRLASSASPADAHVVFKRNSREWSLDGVAGSVTALEDSVARALATQTGATLPEPEAFFLSGDGSSAAGSWIARTSAEPDSIVGYYRGLFRRERQAWKLVRLEVFTSAPATELTSYCHTPGDVISAETTSAFAPLPAEGPVGAPPEGKGQVVFFRPSVFAGGARSIGVREGAAELFDLPNGRYFVYAVEPGTHEYNAGERGEAVRIEVEAGGTYYVQATMMSDMLFGHGELLRSGAAGFNASAPNLRNVEIAQQAAQ